MIDPARMLGTAKALLLTEIGPTEEALRRSISTSYYALFHLIVRAGADRFFGVKNRADAGYILLYRGYSHTRLKETFKSLDARQLPPKLQRQLKRSSASPALRAFASRFLDLQEQRHSADYDAQATFVQSDALDAIDSAELALQDFRTIPRSEMADILALMLLNRNISS